MDDTFGTDIDPAFTIGEERRIKNTMPYDFGGVFPGVKVTPGSKYKGKGNVSGASGWVDPRDPEENIWVQDLMMPDLMSHEMEHILQNRVTKRYGRNYDKMVWDLYPKDKLKSNLQRAASDTSLGEYLKSKYRLDTPAIYLGYLPKGNYSLQEQFAGLSGLEQYLKVDLTKDPVIRKKFFNDDQQYIDAYKATTGLRTNRLDAKDLPPMTIPGTLPPKPRSWADTILDKFK